MPPLLKAQAGRQAAASCVDAHTYILDVLRPKMTQCCDYARNTNFPAAPKQLARLMYQPLEQPASESFEQRCWLLVFMMVCVRRVFAAALFSCWDVNCAASGVYEKGLE